MEQYIDSSIFDTIPTTTCKITTMKPDSKQHENVFHTSKNYSGPIGSDQSAVLMKHIKESKDNSYIIVVPTTNMASHFYNAFD